MTPRSGAPSVAPPSARSSSHSSKSTSSSIHSHRTSRWDMFVFQVLSLFRLNCYRKIPKISPWAYIFQRPFLRGLFLEGLIFGGVYLWREICVSKSIGLAFSLEGILLFLLCFTLYFRAIFPSTSLRQGLYLGGRFNGWFFALPVWGAYIWRGLYMEGLFLEFYGIQVDFIVGKVTF